MKSTGIMRKIDELGRIVIPKELRKTLDIKVKDSIEISVDNDMIILRKYAPYCTFCGNSSNIIIFKDRYICENCKAELFNEKPSKGKEMVDRDNEKDLTDEYYNDPVKLLNWLENK